MASIQKSARRLRSLYSAAQTEIVRELRGATDFRRANLEAIRSQTDQILTELDQQTQIAVPEETRRHYEDGSFRAIKAFRAAGVEMAGSFTQLDEEAINAIAQEAYMNFGQGIQTAGRDVNRIMSIARRERIRTIIAEGTITAKTRREISKSIKAELADGITVLRDRAGKRWNMDTYAEMLTRTKMVEASNSGLQNRLAQEGADLVQVSDHANACPLCRPWGGEILSITGETEGYETVDEATSAGLFHPNCEHRLVPYKKEIAEFV